MLGKMITFLCMCIGHVVQAATDTRSNTGLTAFPTDVNADVTKLMLTTNSITHVPTEALQGLPVLNYLGIAENLLTVFPNLTAVADTLENLYAYDNEIAFVDGMLVEALHKLKKLSLQSNSLVSFPAITSGAYKSLTYLNLAENPLTTTPSFLHYTALTDLWLHTTNIVEFPAIGDAILVISTLRLEKTLVTEIPIELISGMTSLVSLKLTSASVSSIPSPCETDISALTVLATSTDIAVCECRHVWLKVAAEAGADIQVDDADCSGNFWSTSTVQQLLDACWVPPATITTDNARRLYRGFFCHFPLHSTLSDVTVLKCLSVCLITPACFSFNFLDQGGKGDCVILAPGGNLDLIVTNVTSPNWSYYVI